MQYEKAVFLLVGLFAMFGCASLPQSNGEQGDNYSSYRSLEQVWLTYSGILETPFSERDEIIRVAEAKYLERAQLGDPESQYEMGWAYIEAYYRRDAWNWLEAAASQGHVNAMLNLGEAHYFGFLSEHSEDEQALYWLEKAAIAGQPHACYHTSTYYLEGAVHENGEPWIEANPKKAMAYLECAIKFEHPVALHFMGHMYEDGEFVAQDISRAREFFQRSADQGFAEGLVHVAEFEEQKGNVELAQKYYKSAADITHVNIAKSTILMPYHYWEIGMMYEQGQYYEKNLLEALGWYTASAELGNYLGIDGRDRLLAELSKLEMELVKDTLIYAYPGSDQVISTLREHLPAYQLETNGQWVKVNIKFNDPNIGWVKSDSL